MFKARIERTKKAYRVRMMVNGIQYGSFNTSWYKVLPHSQDQVLMFIDGGHFILDDVEEVDE